jgi:uncharacterized protein YhbP (UPF0306 family)
MAEIDSIARLLRSASTLALATSDASGKPYVAPLFYLADGDLRLYWFSSPSSRHSRNLKANAAAAVTVYRSTRDWKNIRGVQMRGEATVVRDRERRRGVAQSYAERFHLGSMFDAAMARSSLYQFLPVWVRYIDNSVRFGYRFEAAVGDGKGGRR